MSANINDNNEEHESNRALLKAVIQMCRLGGDFYNHVGQNVKHYAVKQVCFDMAKSYFQQISELVELAENRYQLSEEETMTSTSIEDYYQNILSKQVKLNPRDLVAHLEDVEEQHLSELNKAIATTNDPQIAASLTNVVSEIQSTYQKLANVTVTELENQ